MSAALMFLGLIFRSGRVVVGEEACGMEARARHLKLILTACDAGRSSLVKARSHSEKAACPLCPVPWSKDDLGGMLGRGGTGVIGITDLNMALAFVQKLDAEEPGTHASALEALTAAEEKAKQRKAEEARHRENKKRGRK
ncbi:MAG: hypothetical protein II794_08800 [Oscillospiraceae bacterium]|nr:hypothetical protein [Oscillospiraceae bacterium]